MDWHEIALFCGAGLFAIGGWCWVRTVNQLDMIEARLTAHAESDRVEFGKVYERLGQEIRALDARVDNRLIARDHRL